MFRDIETLCRSYVGYTLTNDHPGLASQICSMTAVMEGSRLSHMSNSVLNAGWEMMSATMSHGGQAQQAPLLMMTTSGLKRLGESTEEEHINQDLR